MLPFWSGVIRPKAAGNLLYYPEIHVQHPTGAPNGPLCDSRRPNMTKKTQKRTKPAKPAAKRAKAAGQVAPVKKTNPPKPPGKAYVLFGADEYAKPRAAKFSAFSAEDAALLAKAAEAMHLGLVEATDPDVAEVAATLPAGRLHANGKGLVPYIKGAMHMELFVAVIGYGAPQAHRAPTAQDLPGTWDDVAPGQVVL